MKVTYTPRGQAPREFIFRANSLKSSQASQIEKMWDGEPASFAGFVGSILQGSARAVRLLLWHLLTVEGGIPLRFAEVDPYLDEVVVEIQDEELDLLASNMEQVAAGETNPDEKQSLLDRAAAIRQQIEAPKAEDRN